MNQLSKKQRRGLGQFADGAISLDELLRLLDGVLEIDFASQERKLTMHYVVPEPGVRIELTHIHKAMDRHARGEITTEQLAEWAAMLLLNDAFQWEGPEENEIAEWLNEISNLTLKPQPPKE